MPTPETAGEGQRKHGKQTCNGANNAPKGELKVESGAANPTPSFLHASYEKRNTILAIRQAQGCTSER